MTQTEAQRQSDALAEKSRQQFVELDKHLAADAEEEQRGKDANAALRQRSGTVTVSNDRLVSFLYELLRDHLSPGLAETLVRAAELEEEVITYSNGWLAQYAKDLANRLRPTPNPELERDRQALIAEISRGLAILGDDERVKAFAVYCRHCGALKPCHCWNDE